MKFLVVSSTRRTSVGTFRPGVVYALDETKKPHADVIRSLVTGKDKYGHETRAKPVGKVVDEAEAKKLLEMWAQDAAREMGGAVSSKATGDGAINSLDLAGLERQADQAEKDRDLAQRQVADLEAAKIVSDKASKDAAAQISSLTAQVTELSDQLQQATAALEVARKTPDVAKGKTAGTEGDQA